ncbi:MAG: PKD domain-containing protein [Thermoplasmatota archaeon]|nr:PKD domain-containing protein [Candidatus Thermoplasmatota archaeon]MBU1915229.1 PKD domain-containing protein [Candidatus Thermoplasmatota archaeon]
MTKRIAAILICAVMVLVAAAPLALATQDVIKGAKGPRASAVTWEYPPVDYGTWTGHIVNTGLRSLVVDVYDNTGGVLVQISHQRIRFAAYDAYPNGILDTAGTLMAAGHVYSITVTPNGPKGSSCTVDDMFKVAPSVDNPPVAAFTFTVSGLTVNVDASGSSDDKGIVSYTWTWDDGTTTIETDPIASHTYTKPVVVSASALSARSPPGTPHPVFGYTYAADGVTPVNGCLVTITDTGTGESITYTEAPDSNIYSVDLSELQLGWAFGDILKVTATTSTMAGSAEGPITDTLAGYDQIDVILTSTGVTKIVTLTVTDTIGQTSSVSWPVTLTG